MGNESKKELILICHDKIIKNDCSEICVKKWIVKGTKGALFLDYDDKVWKLEWEWKVDLCENCSKNILINFDKYKIMDINNLTKKDFSYI